MAKSNTLEIIIRAKDAASGAFKKAGGAMNVFRKRIQSLEGTVFNLKTAFAGLGLGLLARDLVQSSDEQAKAVMGLETAMKSMGRYTPELSSELQTLASSMQDVTNFGDEATIAGQKFLVTYRDISDDLLPSASKAMLDLAALMGGDTVQAANMLGKASMGMTGELRRVGIVVSKETYKLEGFAGVLSEIETQAKGQARAMREATGPWIAIGMAIGDVKEKLGDVLKGVFNEIGEDVLSTVGLIDKALKQFKESGDFEAWAKKTREEVISVFEKMLLGTAAFYDGMKPIIDDIKTVLSSMWESFKSLPPWVQKVGFVGAFLGGKAGKVAVGGMLISMSHIKNLAAASALVQAKLMPQKLLNKLMWRPGELDTYIKEWDEANKAIVETTIKTGDAAKDATKPAKNLFEAFTGAETATQKVQILLAYLRELKKEEKPAETPDKPGAAPTGAPAISADALSKSQLVRLKATTKTALAILENTYKRGEVAIEQYFAQRQALIEESVAAEIEALQELADAETKDPEKKLALEDQIFRKKEEHARILLELTQQQTEAEDALAQKKLEVEEMLAGMRGRAGVDTGISEMDVGFADEQAEMAARHEAELEQLRELNGTKAEIDEAYRLQKREKDKLLAEQEERLFNARLATAKDVAAGLQDAFTTLYEASGKKQKEFFYLAKAASIAQTLISTYQAAMGAYASLASIPYVGPALGVAAAAVIVAAGAAKVSMIRSQNLATGGEVKGHSPSNTADNIPIMATAKEFMQPVSTVKYYGKGVMEAMRQRLIPREIFQGIALPAMPAVRQSYAYATGGSIAPHVPDRDERHEEKQQEITIINVTDAREIDAHLASAAGQDAVLNVLSSRSLAVRKILR